jgi:4-deoxy-L-threo-5-hexosulose-uronate ketol-isomerase
MTARTLHGADPVRLERMNSREILEAFLINTLFQPGRLALTVMDTDRLVAGSAAPLAEPILLDAPEALGASFFLERREAGFLNLGGAGQVVVDGAEYLLEKLDALYAGRGSRNVEFKSLDPADPALFYIVSYPAHAAFPTTLVRCAQAQPMRLGRSEESNCRTVYKYVHPDGAKSCQLVMGCTLLEKGSVWNTYPPHLHERRSEVYLYFGLGAEGRVFHFMGRPGETRHLVVRDLEAVVSPAWSIHSGAGTRSYGLVWAMGGENLDYKDSRTVAPEELCCTH